MGPESSIRALTSFYFTKCESREDKEGQDDKLNIVSLVSAESFARNIRRVSDTIKNLA